MTNIATNLTKVNPDMSNFCSFVSALLKADSSIPESGSINNMFQDLSVKRYWSHLDVSYLERIVEEFGGALVDESRIAISQYKERLSTYKKNIKIAEVSSSREVRSTIEYSCKGYDQRYRSKLSIKMALDRSTMPLLYLEELWDSVFQQFSASPFSSILEVEEEASHIVIHWIVHNALAQAILERINMAEELFENNGIVNARLEDVVVFDQETGGVSKKVRYLDL